MEDLKIRFDVEYYGEKDLPLYLVSFLKRMFPEIREIKIRMMGKRE
jgi:hypothetical protein